MIKLTVWLLGLMGLAHNIHPVYLFSPDQLLQVEDYLYSVLTEKSILANKLTTLRRQSEDLQDKLDNITISITDHKAHYSSANSSYPRLESLRITVIGLIRAVGSLEGSVSGEQAVSEQQENQITSLKERLGGLQTAQNQQGSLLAQAETILAQSQKKLADSLNNTPPSSAAAISDSDTDNICLNAKVGLTNDCNLTRDFAAFLNSRRCEVGSITVDVDSDSGTGYQVHNFASPELFAGITPTIFCASAGFESLLQPSHSQALNFGFGSLLGDRHDVNVAMHCQASQGSVLVTVFDQSRGQVNQVNKVFVTIKVCTFGSRASSH